MSESKLTPQVAEICAETMAAIPFYPSEGPARGIIASEIEAMCSTEEQAKWLVRRMIRLYSKWPGVREMRTVLCSKYKPLDGIESSGTSDTFPDGIPSERPQLEAPIPLRLNAATPAEISAAPSLAGTVCDLARAKSMANVGNHVGVREIPVVQITDANRITQADIERAERELRMERAKAAGE